MIILIYDLSKMLGLVDRQLKISILPTSTNMPGCVEDYLLCKSERA